MRHHWTKVSCVLAALTMAGGCSEDSPLNCTTDDPNATANMESGTCVIQCHEGFADIEGICTAVVCKPNSSVCDETKEERIKVCRADGMGYETHACITDDPNADAICKDGECNIVCHAGFKAINDTCVLTDCIPDQLSPEGDDDNDGILNGIEQSQGASDPCLADTDGDTIPDGSEDLNHDGIIQIEFGETDPSDAASRPGSTSEAETKAFACNATKMLDGENIDLKDMRVAKLKNAAFENHDTFAVFKHNQYPVVGFFGSSTPMTGSYILKDAIGEGNYIEESNFKSSVPLAAWSKTGVYQTSLQVVPNHVVDRYKLTINMGEDDTLGSLRNKIAKSLFGIEVTASNDTTNCESENSQDHRKAIFYLARSIYSGNGESTYIYSGALACREAVVPELSADPVTLETFTETSNIMDDTISGTLVSPKRIGNPNGYAAFEQFVCQAEFFGDSQGAVDFIWVIDNSGSMQDEIDNLTKTVDEFTKRLDMSGIDYRLAVTTTDAYLIDEVGNTRDGQYSYDELEKSVTYVPFVKEGDTYSVHMNGYFNGLGIHTIDLKYPCMLRPRQIDLFKRNVSQYASELNPNDCVGNLNICGKGYEDGFKSGAIVLERLFYDVMGPKPAHFTDEAWTEFSKIKHSVAYSNAAGLEAVWRCQTEDEQATPRCQNYMDSCTLRDHALKYVIFVSDEDSRQFKENSRDGDLTVDHSHLYGCLTGYQLTSSGGVYQMAMGMYKGQACNPPMTTYKEELAATLSDHDTLDGMSLKDIQKAKPEYYDMLSYYLDTYRKYAGSQGVVAFALVGDAGLDNGGFCRKLATCEESKCNKIQGTNTLNYTDLNGNGKYERNECNDCSDWNTNDLAATIGANHGLSYIHLARFLSTVYTDANGVVKTDGKEGGYGSICNTDYSVTVNSIVEDIVGRVSPHALKGYPISSTIRVAAIINGETVELKRGDTTTGWRYDASQNAIIFNFADENNRPSPVDHIAISYVIWKPVQD